jgi:hypothetical protein
VYGSFFLPRERSHLDFIDYICNGHVFDCTKLFAQSSDNIGGIADLSLLLHFLLFFFALTNCFLR